MKRYRAEVMERFVVYVDAETEEEAKTYIEAAAPIPAHEGITHAGRSYKLTEQEPEEISCLAQKEKDLLEIYRLQRYRRRVGNVFTADPGSECGEMWREEWGNVYDRLKFLYARFRTRYGHSYKTRGGYSCPMNKGMVE